MNRTARRAVQDTDHEPTLEIAVRRPEGPITVIPKTVDGLPLHPLIIHATVVMLPLAALSVAIAGLWPRARRQLHVTPLILSVLALILLPLSFQSGENLKEFTGSNPLIERHEELAHQLLWPVIGLFVAALLIEIVRRRSSAHRQPTQLHAGRREMVTADSGSTALAMIAGVLAVVFSVWTTVQTVRVGEAGAKAVWSHSHSESNSGSDSS
jgi:hypothetical protein